MEEGRPSTIARRLAELRAAHHLLDRPLVFDDPLALRILAVDDAAGLPAIGSL